MAERFYNSEAYFDEVRIADYGFREYDARWVIAPVGGKDESVDLNFRGLTQLGYWLGSFLQLPENGGHGKLLVGHDFRKYSENAKNAVCLGLLSSGLDVDDLGLCLTPVVYHAQYAYGVPACAMVTASHNPNGWTGVKIGYDYSRTFGAEKMAAFKAFAQKTGIGFEPAEKPGGYRWLPGAVQNYLSQLIEEWAPRLEGLPRVRVALETGNGTAGIVFPKLLEQLGFDVVYGNVSLDWDFPNFNPNPESVPFLRSVQDLVRKHGAEVGICIDGDGDRLGVVVDDGSIVFSDRVALLLARKLESLSREPVTFVVDVKSTSLFNELKSKVVWEKTGHSYIKTAVARNGAAAGFERSGHFFFTPPYGKGYDDSCVSALLLLWVLCEAKAEGRKLSHLLAELPASHQSPNRQPKVPETRKYAIVDEIRARIEQAIERDGGFAGVAVEEVITINGIRLQFADKSWLLIRASSNAPVLVILAEAFDEGGGRLEEIDGALRALIADMDEIGPFEPLHEI